MERYYFSRDTYLAVTSEAAIILDLNRGNYVALSPDQVARLRACVHGWPERELAESELQSKSFEQCDEMVKPFLVTGLLTQNREVGKPEAHTELEQIDEWLLDPDTIRFSRVSFTHVLSLARAWVWASVSMRSKPMKIIVRAIQQQRGHLAREHHVSDLNETRRLVAAFLTLRPFFYSHKDRCLLDSLVLIRFLGIYRIFPHLVFGVRELPFSAHAWVQCGRFVINCRPGSAQRFRPILVI
jgi:Transglutaminase-like superfamily